VKSHGNHHLLLPIWARQVIGELTAAMLAGSALHRGMATMVSWHWAVGRELSQHQIDRFHGDSTVIEWDAMGLRLNAGWWFGT